MRFGGWSRVAVFGCGMQLIPRSWDTEMPVVGPYGTLCTYPPATGSWAHCVNEVISENSKNFDAEFNSTISFVNLVCMKAGGNLVQYTLDEWMEIRLNATQYVKPLPSGNTRLNYPVELDSEIRRMKIRGVKAEFTNLDNSNDAALWVYYFFGALLIVTIFSAKIRLPTRLCVFVKSKFIVPTSFGIKTHTSHSKWAMGGLWPNAEESTILTLFSLVHTAALVFNYSIDPDEILESVLEQWLQALGNRSGIVSFGLLPILVVLTTRSALLMNFFGYKYTTLLVLHRWIGRAIIFDAVVHSIAFYYHERLSGALANVSGQFWWFIGIVATAVSCLILLFGAGAFRRRWYELFLYTHIAFAAVFFYTCWKHVENFGWLGWLKWSIGLWICERLYRVALVARHGIQTAVVTEVSSLGGEPLIVLTLKKPSTWHMRPSQYAFIYFCLPSVCWQSHPFTVTDMGDHLKIVIAVKSGATLSVQNALKTRINADNDLKIKCFLEGPYGIPPDLQKFDRALVFGGGSGVPGPISLALDSLRFMSPELIHLVIVIRDWSILDAYKEEITALVASKITIDIHYTGRSANHYWEQVFDIITGRPDISNLVSENTVGVESIGVVCCGPPGFNDIARNVVAKRIAEAPKTKIEYFEEFQIW